MKERIADCKYLKKKIWILLTILNFVVIFIVCNLQSQLSILMTNLGNDYNISVSLPIILLVTYRETFLGCGNYHVYLQKEFETIFCLPDDYIKLLNIDELINNNTYNYNIHLIRHKQLKGEMWCREQAINYIINNNKNIDYLLSWNCEATPFDINYKQSNALPFIDIIKKLIYTYKYELNRRRNNIKSLPMPKNSEPNGRNRSFYDLFAITPTLWENWYKTDQLGIDSGFNDIKFHANGVIMYWSHKHFMNKYGYINNSIPWTFDILNNTETHVIMYNFTLLNKYKHVYFVNNNYTAWLAEPSNIQQLFEQYNINVTIIRSNDVNTPIDFGSKYSILNTFINKKSITFVNKIRQWHWKSMADKRSPKGLFDHWFIPYKVLNQHRINWYGHCFMHSMWSPLWMINFDINDLSHVFDLFGYDLIDNRDYYTFKMKNIYPASIVVSNSIKHNENMYGQGHLFLIYYDKSQNKNISIYSFPWRQTNSYQRRFKQLLSLDLNKTEIKINKNSTIIEITNPIPSGLQCKKEIVNRDSMIHFAKLMKLL